LVVLVVYFDVRSAVYAMSSQGLQGILSCTALPQHCQRAVHVSGEFQLDAESVQGVSNMYDDPDLDGAFVLEFFDSRNAMRVEDSVRRWVAGESSTCSEAAPSLPDVADEVTVRIDGLPNAICNGKMLEAVLQQAGLEDSVLSMRPQKGNPCGSAEVTLSGRDAAELCLRHFKGCAWDRSGRVVSSSIVESATPVDMCPKAWSRQRGCAASEGSTLSPCGSESLVSPPPGLSLAEVQQPSKQRSKLRQHIKAHGRDAVVATAATVSTCASEPHSDIEVLEVS